MPGGVPNTETYIKMMDYIVQHDGCCSAGQEIERKEAGAEGTWIERHIILDNLSIGYNGQPVLSGISLSIPRASFTAILGANGSGKSTLLKTVLGLLPPLAGRIDTASRCLRLCPSVDSVRSDLSVDGV